MGRWWSKTKYVLGTLALMMLQQQPEVAMQLRFTVGSAKLARIEKEDDIVKLMKDNSVRPNNFKHTNMEETLGHLFEEHVQSIRKPLPRNKRLLTLIILTDGLWKATNEKADVQDKITTFVKEVSQLQGKYRQRPVSIQFIQLGKDIDAMFFLQHLDNNLANKEKGIP